MKTELKEMVKEAELVLKEQFIKIDEICDSNSEKVLSAFQEFHLSEAHLGTTTGYGYSDLGRDTIEEIYAEIFKAEDALVRNQFISGSHALTVALFGLLRPGDTLLSITGKPYDTLEEVIGIRENASSLKSFGIYYDQIELKEDEFDEETILTYLKNNKVKVIEIQRSRGYSTRITVSIEQIERIVKKIKEISKDTIIMIDNCYCEFVGKKEPIEVGADIVVGSLIKNLGGGIASNGAYIVGRKDLIALCADRLTVPGEGKEVGPSLGANKLILQGLYFAPSVVASSLKTAVLASYLLEQLGYEVNPKWNDKRADIVQMIIFHSEEKQIKYCQGIQMGSPVDSSAIPLPWDMPGYDSKIIMASGSFTQGSSIELSCDGPIKPPYVAYMQGGLTYSYGKLGVMTAIENILE